MYPRWAINNPAQQIRTWQNNLYVDGISSTRKSLIARTIKVHGTSRISWRCCSRVFTQAIRSSSSSSYRFCQDLRIKTRIMLCWQMSNQSMHVPVLHALSGALGDHSAGVCPRSQWLHSICIAGSLMWRTVSRFFWDIWWTFTSGILFDLIGRAHLPRISSYWASSLILYLSMYAYNSTVPRTLVIFTSWS
jgi:hypothetical protein